MDLGFLNRAKAFLFFKSIGLSCKIEKSDENFVRLFYSILGKKDIFISFANLDLLFLKKFDSYDLHSKRHSPPNS